MIDKVKMKNQMNETSKAISSDKMESTTKRAIWKG